MNRTTLMLITGRVVGRERAAEIAAGRHPRKDYLELARALDAEILDHDALPDGRWGRLLRRCLGPSLLLAWQGFRRRGDYRLLYSDSEAIGLPLALMLKVAGDRRPHLMIAHVLTPLKKAILFRWFKAHGHISTVICHASRQYEQAVNRLGVPAERAALLPYQVDDRWWRPAEEPPAATPTPGAALPIISSAGLERRDYGTLLAAIEDLPARLVIAAASQWSKRRDETHDRPLPANAEVVSLDYAGLRDLYARSAFVVVPLHDVDFQAGITTILEAMAMGKAVIVSHALGQEDVVIDRRIVTRGPRPRVLPSGFARLVGRPDGYGPTGLYVAPGDAAALRRAIAYLLEHPGRAAELGANGRRLVGDVMSLDAFTGRIAHLAGRCLAGATADDSRPSAAVAAGSQGVPSGD